jgi:hypothetical protein
MSDWRGCTTPGCYRPEHARGLCMKHYQAARYRGLLDALPTRQKPSPQRMCTAAGCGRAAHGRGLCHKHLKAAS